MGIKNRRARRRLSKYNDSRLTLLIVALLSLISIVIMAAGVDMYFLFSAYIPILITSLGMSLCGKFPPEFYDQNFEGGYASMEFLDEKVFYVFVAIAIAIVLVYVALYFLSGKGRGGWLIASLVLFIIDTVIMLTNAPGIRDIVFHVIIIVSLCIGLADHYRTKSAREE
ncbi:MAG: hypothetical protein J6V09_06140 [Clostridia bacterium]|nr:hypothetical protein [Clostridia bacterium]